jgi:hypothetical protein
MPAPLAIKTTARKLKVTAILAPEALASLEIGENIPSRAQLSIAIDGRTYRAETATKSVRKAVATIKANGADGIVVILQGVLANDGATILEAGLTAQVKTKPAAEPQGVAKDEKQQNPNSEAEGQPVSPTTLTLPDRPAAA